MQNRSLRILVGNIVACVAMLVLLVACGDNEPEQRKAFIDIIQKNILDQKGGRIVFLEDADKKALGSYVEQFTFLTDAVDAVESLTIDAQAKKMDGLVRELNRTEDALKRRQLLDDIDALKNEVRTSIEKMTGELNAKKEAIKQPADLKEVYDKAYDKLIATQAEVALRIFDASDAFMKTVRELNEYIIAHPGKVKLQGSDVMVLDPSAEQEVNRLLKAQMDEFNAMQKVLQEALRIQKGM